MEYFHLYADQDWINLIKTNDESTVQNILKASDKERTSRLLNKPLNKPLITNDNSLRKQQSQYDIELSICYAVAYAAFDVIQILLEHGAKIDACDDHGNNILHCLTLRSHLSGHKAEEDFIKSFEWIKKTLPMETFRAMMRKSNKKQMNPMEYAAHLDAWGLFTVMFEVLKCEEIKSGAYITT